MAKSPNRWIDRPDQCGGGPAIAVHWRRRAQAASGLAACQIRIGDEDEFRRRIGTLLWDGHVHKRVIRPNCFLVVDATAETTLGEYGS
jgi:hypothetical protein